MKQSYVLFYILTYGFISKHFLYFMSDYCIAYWKYITSFKNKFSSYGNHLSMLNPIYWMKIIKNVWYITKIWVLFIKSENMNSGFIEHFLFISIIQSKKKSFMFHRSWFSIYVKSWVAKKVIISKLHIDLKIKVMGVT